MKAARFGISPPAWADIAMAKLSHARHLISPYATHNVAAQSCAGNLIADFISGDELASIDAECLNKDVRRGFYLNASTVEPLPENKS